MQIKKNFLIRKRYFSNVDTSHIKRIAVIGAGQMGGGIALVVAQIAKKEVVVIDVNDSVLKNCQKFLESLLKKMLIPNPCLPIYTNKRQ